MMVRRMRCNLTVEYTSGHVADQKNPKFVFSYLEMGQDAE